MFTRHSTIGKEDLYMCPQGDAIDENTIFVLVMPKKDSNVITATFMNIADASDWYVENRDKEQFVLC